MSGFDFYRRAGSTEELVEAFAAELAKQEAQPEAPKTTVADVAGLVVKCAEQLEAGGQDAAPADEVLQFLEAEFLTQPENV